MKVLTLLLFISCLLPCRAYSQTHKVLKDNINVREDSRVTSESLGFLSAGELVQSLTQKYGWYKICLPERFTGYVWGEFLKEIEDGKAEVLVSILNLRGSPNLDSRIIGKIKKGKILSVVEKGNEWIKVKCFPYAHGWVHSNFLEPVKEEEINQEGFVPFTPEEIEELLKVTDPADYLVLDLEE